MGNDLRTVILGLAVLYLCLALLFFSKWQAAAVPSRASPRRPEPRGCAPLAYARSPASDEVQVRFSGTKRWRLADLDSHRTKKAISSRHLVRAGPATRQHA